MATSEMLKMLYILTMADVAAVGPGTLTAWKKDLLAELFEKGLEILTGEKVEIDEGKKIWQIKEWLLAQVGSYEPIKLALNMISTPVRACDTGQFFFAASA